MLLPRRVACCCCCCCCLRVACLSSLFLSVFGFPQRSVGIMYTTSSIGYSSRWWYSFLASVVILLYSVILVFWCFVVFCFLCECVCTTRDFLSKERAKNQLIAGHFFSVNVSVPLCHVGSPFHFFFFFFFILSSAATRIVVCCSLLALLAIEGNRY